MNKSLFFVLLITALAVALSGCNQPGAPPAKVTIPPVVDIPGGQDGGLVPVDQYTPDSNKAQQPAPTGPKAWVEYPSSGAMLPPGTLVMLEVYASDPTGISEIQIKVDGMALRSKALTSAATDGSMRLVKIEQSFRDVVNEDKPVVFWAEGQHTVEVVAFNVNGVSSPASTITFCRGKCFDNRDYTPPAPPSIRETTPTPTPTQPTGIEIVEFYFSPKFFNAGECTTLYWKVSGTQEGVYLNGELVSPSGSREHCACVDETHELKVVSADGTVTKMNTNLGIIEGTSCGLQEQPEEPTPVPDTFGPYIGGNLAWGDCKFYGIAGIIDDSGVSEAKFGYNLNNQGWQWIEMSTSDQANWLSASVSVMEDIGTPMGHIDYQFWAKDNLGNETYTDTYEHDYTSCGG